MKSSFSSQSNGEWQLRLESESGAEGAELRRMFDMQPSGLSCNLDQAKAADGTGRTTLLIYSPKQVRQ